MRSAGYAQQAAISLGSFLGKLNQLLVAIIRNGMLLLVSAGAIVRLGALNDVHQIIVTYHEVLRGHGLLLVIGCHIFARCGNLPDARSNLVLGARFPSGQIDGDFYTKKSRHTKRATGLRIENLNSGRKSVPLTP